MNKQAIGIDVSKDKLDIAHLRSDKYKQAVFPNNETGLKRLSQWLNKQKAAGVHVCIEATGRYGEKVAHTLHEQGYPVSIVNPARIKSYGDSQLKRNKTDRQDAKLIAHFCATQTPTLWTPPPPEAQELQALTRRLETLKQDRTRELNRKQSGLTSQAVLQDIETHIDFLNQQIKVIQKQIDDLIDNHPHLRQQRDLLTSIPGIGQSTAAHLLAEVPDVGRFDSASQLAAYAGLTPRLHQSGSSIYRPGRLVKTGNIRLRTALFMPALAAMRFNPVIQALVKRLELRGKSRMTIVGAVMRKLVHLAFGVLKHQQPFDPHYAVNRQASP